MGRRRDRLALVAASSPRFAAGLLSMPAFLLIDELLPKAGLVLLYGLLAVLAGKRLQIGYFFLTIITVALFQMFIPWGKVLWEIGPLRITLGALERGVLRGLGLVGMVFLSLASVTPRLTFPGRFGGLFGRTFWHFERIIEGKGRLERKNFIEKLDELLLVRFDPHQKDFGCYSPEENQKEEAVWRGAGAAFLLPLVSWGIWAAAG